MNVRNAVRRAGCALAGLAFVTSLYAQAPLNLMTGTSLLGWNAHGSWTGNGGMLATGGGGARNLTSAVPFGEFSLQFEYNETAPMGAKLRVWGSHENTGGFVIDLDNSGAQAGVGGLEGTRASQIASVSQGWHRVQVDAAHGQLSTRIDGATAGNASGVGARGGFLSFEAGGNGTLQVRAVKLTLLNVPNAFNNADLNGWKSVARAPGSSGGVGHAMEKTLTFGLGGGSTKPHSAKWTVHGAAMHGEDGPGGLEYSNQVDDAVVQISASLKGAAKPDNFTGIGLRNTAGQLTGGYLIGIGPYAGAIDGLEKRSPNSSPAPRDETIIIAGRTIAVWVDGALSTVHTDPRPESQNPAQGAKTGAGTATLMLPAGGVQLDVQRVAIGVLPKPYGLAAKAEVPPPAPVVATPSTAAAPPAASAAETALLKQQDAAAKQANDDKQAKQRIASLMVQALGTSDPRQQMTLYNQVVAIDPSNAPAVQGLKDAQAKIQAQEDADQKAANAEVDHQREAQTHDQQVNESLAKAQSSFLAGHIGDANAALAVAERLAPDNPMVRDLRARISATSSLHSRLYMLGSAAGLLALTGLVIVWFRRRRQQRFPVLEMTRGLDSGRRFPLDKDTMRIGAVAQDGGQKNDVVIRDVEHAVSRFHCEIAKKNGQWYVTDLKSSNGTTVNGNRVEPGRPELLRKGARLSLADSVDLRFGFDRRSKTDA